MQTFDNAEIRNDGKLIRANVTIDAYCMPITGPEAGQPQWHGTLKPPNNTGLMKGETYTLILPDSQPATIRVTAEASRDGTVPFKGIGALPSKSLSKASV